MKLASLLVFLTVNAFASNSLKTQLPQDHGLYFLAATSSEIIHKVDKEAGRERGQEVCQYLGYKKLVKMTQKRMGHEVARANGILHGGLVTINLAEYGSGFNAVIDELQCSK